MIKVAVSSLDAPLYSIGRDPKCDIRLISQFVSRRHARLIQVIQEDGSFSYTIVDGNIEGKNSPNGLLINGHQLVTRDLQYEDEIVFGPCSSEMAIARLQTMNHQHPLVAVAIPAILITLIRLPLIGRKYSSLRNFVKKPASIPCHNRWINYNFAALYFIQQKLN